MQKTSLWDIFKIFFIIGIQLIGGGYVILPLLQKYIVNERKWISEEELYDYFAISQCTPGIIAINISIFTGYKIKKLLGAIVAILGIVIPSFICILTLANILSTIVDNKFVQDAFWGIRISVLILIIITIKDMWKKSVNSKFTATIFASILFLLFISISPTKLIIASALFAFLVSKVKGEEIA